MLTTIMKDAMIIAQTGFIFNSVKIKHIFTAISAHPDLGSDVHTTLLEWLLSVQKVFTVIDQDSNGAGWWFYPLLWLPHSENS